jgi:hypothetical protein
MLAAVPLWTNLAVLGTYALGIVLLHGLRA